MSSVEVTPAIYGDEGTIRNLVELYAYDFSEFTDEDVDEHGLFGYRYLDHYWTEAERHPFLIRVDGRIAGFALVRAGRPHDMAEFFVVKKYRGSGVAKQAARAVFAMFPGDWQTRELAANARATAFWRNAIPVPYTEDTNEQGPVQHFHIAGDA
jgi:predicted acetyltransferase